MSETPSLSSIGIKIESTDAATAAARLDNLAAAGDAADKAVGQIASTSKDAAAQLGNVGAAAQQLAQAQGATNQQIKAATISSAQYAQSLRLLPIQIHQGFDQLLYGTNPLIVLSTQLPQITESFGGIGNAIKALGTLITPVSVGITAFAAAIGAVGYAWYEAGAEQDAFAKKLITTGNAVGLTTDQLEALAKQIQNAGVSHGDAVSALLATLSAGITQNVDGIAKLAAQLQELGGNPIATTVKQFASLGQDPVKAAESLQRSLAFLTPEVYNEIAALQKSGDTAAASALARGQLTKSLSDQVELLKEAQGGWSGLGQAIKSFFSDASSAIGQDLNPGLARQIEDLKQQILVAKSGSFTSIAGPSSQAQIAGLEAQLQRLEARLVKAQGTANQNKANASGVDAAIQANAQAQQAAQLAASQQAGSILDTAGLDAIQRGLEANLSLVQHYDSLLDAEHSAHLLSDKAYYDAKAKLIDVDTQTQVEALKDQNAALEQQNQRIQQAAQVFASAHSGPADVAEVTKNWADADAKVAANQEKVLDNQAKINQLTDDAASKVKLLGIEQQSAAKAAQNALDNLIASENQYLQTLERSYNLQLQGLTAGPNLRARLQDLSQVDAQALQQRQQLDQAKRINPELPNYDAQVKAIEDAHKKALADTNAYYDSVDKAQSQWQTGALLAFNTYGEAAANVADQSDKLFTDAFQGMEDALVTFATTGKLSFSSLADSIVADLDRIAIKYLENAALNEIFGFFSGDFGAGQFGQMADQEIKNNFTLGSVPGAATGGPISGPTIVGEAGPELFIPNTSGYVVPNHQLRSMGAPAIVNNYAAGAFAPGLSVSALNAQLDARDASLKAQIANEIYRGGWKAVLQKGLS